MKNTAINHSTVWAQLHQHQRATRHLHMRDLFAQAPNRFLQMHVQQEGLLFDYSKNRITARTLELLIELAQEALLPTWMQNMQAGAKINLSEDRAVLHTALRLPKNAQVEIDGQNIMPKIQQELQRAFSFAESLRLKVHTGFSKQPITDVVNLGIGGSDLGPLMTTQALRAFHGEIHIHYVSNVDGAHLSQTLKNLNPEQTLFIIASKSFTTPETILNAQAAREWFLNKGTEHDISKHFVAVSSQIQAAIEFGIEPNHVFALFDWVGGRYSTWSTIGLSVMIAIGATHFSEFLAGGHAMDQHFFQAPFAKNIPVLMGLIGIWYNTFYGAHSHAIIPYDHNLRRFPAHIQQLDMESNGKQVGRTGILLDFDTGPIIWGEEGVNCQHAFFQLLHQGTRLIPADFIVPIQTHYPQGNQHNVLVANAFAQTEALMRGKTKAEAKQELADLSDQEKDFLASQKTFPGNRPSNTLLFKEINPFSLGQLLALYEHKVFVQGVIWGINSFDQWGVEYGKVLATHILPELTNLGELNHDASTNGLIAYFREHIHA